MPPFAHCATLWRDKLAATRIKLRTARSQIATARFLCRGIALMFCFNFRRRADFCGVRQLAAAFVSASQLAHSRADRSVQSFMDAFRNHLTEIASRGEVVNTLFEERLYGLVSIVHRIADALAEESVPYELVGGLAVLIYLEAADPSQSTLTRDVDVMINRPQIDHVKRLAEQHGFHFRHATGLDMLTVGAPDTARNAVHLVYSGEREGARGPSNSKPAHSTGNADAARPRGGCEAERVSG